jgi:hypothetical protein
LGTLVLGGGDGKRSRGGGMGIGDGVLDGGSYRS